MKTKNPTVYTVSECLRCLLFSQENCPTIDSAEMFVYEAKEGVPEGCILRQGDTVIRLELED